MLTIYVLKVFNTLCNTASPTAPQNPLCRKVRGSNPGQLSIGYYIYFRNLPKTIVLRSMFDNQIATYFLLLRALLYLGTCIYKRGMLSSTVYAILSPDELLL